MTDLEMIGQAYIVWYQCNARAHRAQQELSIYMDDPAPTIGEYTDESFKKTLSSLSKNLLTCLQETTKAYDVLDGLMLNYLIKQAS